MSALCVCGEPVESCPHLGVFANLEEKRTFYRAVSEAADELHTLGVRAEAAQAIAIAQRAAQEASKLPLSTEVVSALGVIVAALAKAAALAGLP